MKKNSLREEIIKFAAERYGTKPEYLWAKYPHYAVLRHTGNRKWYAIIMDIPKSKLGLDDKNTVDAINLKTDPYLAGSLRMEKGIFPAYHMNKGNWITVLLDGTVDLEKIKELLDMSFGLTNSKARARKNLLRVADWIVPANPKYYDIDKAVKENEDGTFLWKQSNNICVGDTVYLYVAAPVSAIRYKCRAVEVNIPYEYSDENVSMKKVMRLKLLNVLNDDLFGYEVLKEYGVYAVHGPRSMPPSLKEEIDSMLDDN